MARVLHLVKGAWRSEGTKPPDTLGHSHDMVWRDTTHPTQHRPRHPSHEILFTLSTSWSSVGLRCCMLSFTVVWWSSLLFDGLYSCLIQLFDCLYSCLMVFTVVWWTSQLFDGLYSCLIVFTVVWWTLQLLDRLHCCLIVFTVVWWSSLLFDGLHQGFLNTVLERWCPADFSWKPDQTHLMKFRT